MKKIITNAISNIPRKGQHNIVKILCLTLGLSISAVIIAEIYYEQTYNQSFPDHKRICRVTEGFQMKEQEYTEGSQTPGGVAPLMMKTIPQVELATRVNPLVTGEVETNDKKRLNADIYLTDSCFFKMFPTEIITGDAEKALNEPFCCGVTRSFAERLGGNVLGKQITPLEMADLKLTIACVFEDYPHNSSFHNFDVIGAMKSQESFSFDGSDNLLGNDRYLSYVKLCKGTNPDALRPLVKNMIQTHFPVKEMKQSGITIDFMLTPISHYYTSQQNVKQMFWILSLLALVILSAAILNYILIVIGNMMSRAREMAVRKCYGAGRKAILGITFGEAFIHILLALTLGIILLWATKGTIEQMLSAPISVLILNRGSWILIAIVVIVLIIGGIVPGILYDRMPVAIAFRGYAEARHHWKEVLLGVEFAMVSFLLGLLFVVSLQYHHTVNFDLGYQCKNIAMVRIGTLSAKEREIAIDEIKRMGTVKDITACNTLPLNCCSGNCVKVPGEHEELFNIADFYSVSDNYFKIMDIPIVAGREFEHCSDSLKQVMVSESFAKRMNALRGWKDVVGKKVIISEHSGEGNQDPITIIGVYKDILIGDAENYQYDKPSVMFYRRAANEMNNYLLIRLSDFSVRTLNEIQSRLQRFFPGKTVIVESLENTKNLQYTPTRNFRNGVMVAGFVTLLIALTGLVGYVNDEVNRRHKEIAIRKVNGARALDIIRIFQRGIMLTAIPATIIGSLASYFVSAYWLQLYGNRITLSVWTFLVTTVCVLLIVAVIVTLNCRRVANSNPVNYLKQE